jgi:nucleotide-binding universal stress UspA family protein
VIVNENGLRDVGWHYRVGVLAHELTHTLQYEFSGGSRGTSEQWLREGFAEWVEVEVLVALGFTTRLQARTIAVNQLRDAGAPTPLSRMVTFPDWVALAQRGGQEPIYAQALLAAELLLERHGVPAAIEYFRRFASSDDRLANFRQAFGEELSDFDRAFAAHAAALVR